jgi:CRISPR-associated endonuclease Cas1
MQPEVTAFFPDLSPRSGVVVVDGYGSSIRVHRGQLSIVDGIGPSRRERAFSRANSRMRRIVVLGHSGTVSLDAIRWIADVRAAFIHLDADGTVLATTAILGNDDPRLRRAQALAMTSPIGLRVARSLIGAKLEGQVRVLASIGAEPSMRLVQVSIERLDRADSLNAVLHAESKGAAAYWAELADVKMPFVRKDRARVPDHWRTIGPRSSPLTESPRLAVTPAGALFNYVYAVSEAETRLACLAVGLDPGLGILHADLRARDSLVLDVMEALRPEVDSYVLDLMLSHVFSARDFVETRQGTCRVLPPLTHHLAATGSLWARSVAPVVEGVARMLASADRIDRISTPLTQANRSVARAHLRSGTQSVASAGPPPVCAACGAEVPSTRRTYCDECLSERRAGVLADFKSSGPAELARLRAAGKDPTRTEGARRAIGARNARRRIEAAAWDAENARPDPDEFRREVLPGIQMVTVNALMRATGLSKRYVWRIRRGEYVPHPRHWEALRNAAGHGGGETR